MQATDNYIKAPATDAHFNVHAERSSNYSGFL